MSTAWTFDEEQIVLRDYPTEGPSCAHKLPGRSQHAVELRAQQMGVAPKRRHALWTEIERQLIRGSYTNIGAERLASYLPGRTPSAIKEYARRLGVKAPPRVNDACAWCSQPSTCVVRDGDCLDLACDACAAVSQ
jgi:hypothetical protein